MGEWHSLSAGIYGAVFVKISWMIYSILTISTLDIILKVGSIECRYLCVDDETKLFREI